MLGRGTLGGPQAKRYWYDNFKYEIYPYSGCGPVFPLGDPRRGTFYNYGRSGTPTESGQVTSSSTGGDLFQVSTYGGYETVPAYTTTGNTGATTSSAATATGTGGGAYTAGSTASGTGTTTGAYVTDSLQQMAGTFDGFEIVATLDSATTAFGAEPYAFDTPLTEDDHMADSVPSGATCQLWTTISNSDAIDDMMSRCPCDGTWTRRANFLHHCVQPAIYKDWRGKVMWGEKVEPFWYNQFKYHKYLDDGCGLLFSSMDPRYGVASSGVR